MSSYGTEFPSWVSKCNIPPFYSEVCNNAFNINFYATLVAMVAFGLIIFIDHKRINRILCGVAPGVLFFMIHSMINTFFWISRLAVSDSKTFDIRNAINFLDYVEVFDIGIFCLQIVLFLCLLLWRIMNNMYKNSVFVILFTSVFSSVLFYSNTSQFFSLFVPPSQNFEARLTALIWMPLITIGMMALITTVRNFLDLLSFSFKLIYYGYDRMNEIVIVQDRK